MNGRGSALAALLILLPLGACADERRPAAADPPLPLERAAVQPSRESVPSARLVRFFDELVYGSPASPEGASPTLVRWTVPSLTYAIVGPAPPDARRRIAERLARLQQLTGIAAISSGGAEAQLVFEFVRGSRVPVRDELAACSTRITFDAGGIRQAQIYIATEPARTFAACLDHELLHAFGFPHHSSVLPSVMGPIRWSDTLSEADETVLRALYDRRLDVGLTKEQAAPALAQILAQSAAERPGSSLRLGADLEWHTIRPGETALAFDPPGLERSVRRNFWAAPSDGGYVVEISFLAAPEREWPRATVRYVRLSRERAFSRYFTPEDIARSWPTVAEASPQFRPAAEYATALATMRYAIADTAAGPCIVFVADFRDRQQGRSDRRLDGFYCAPKGTVLNIAAVLDSLSLRSPGYRSPGIARYR